VIPPPVTCPRCGKSAAVHVYMKCYLCYGCFWQQTLTADEYKQCFREIVHRPTKEDKYAVLPARVGDGPTSSYTERKGSPLSARTSGDIVYFPGDLVSDIAKEAEENPTGLLISMIREKAKVRKHGETLSTIK
jgi:hypothetical protein